MPQVLMLPGDSLTTLASDALAHYVMSWPGVTQRVELIPLVRPSMWDRLLTEESFRWGEWPLSDLYGGNKVELEAAIEHGPRRTVVQTTIPTRTVTYSGRGADTQMSDQMHERGNLVWFEKDWWVVVDAEDPFAPKERVEPSRKQKQREKCWAAQERARVEQRKRRPTKPKGLHPGRGRAHRWDRTR